jgi:hypothetical protein
MMKPEAQIKQRPTSIEQLLTHENQVTQTLVSVFDALAIPVVDHIIVAGPRTFSMAEAGLLRAAVAHRAGGAL